MNKNNEVIADTLDNIPASQIEAPGQGYGPCKEACAHRDCAWQRETIARPCSLCGQSVGFGRLFYEYDGDVAHRACLEEQIDDAAPAQVH